VAVYDVFALKRVTPRDGVVEADLRCLPARLYALLPAAIARVELRGPKKVKGGQAFAWSAAVQDEDGQAIRASIPLRVRLLDAAGRLLDEQFTAAGSKGASGTMRALLNAAPGAQTLEATELFSGQTARLGIAVAAPASPASLTDEKGPPSAAADSTARGKGPDRGLTAPLDLFGPHLRDLVVTAGGKLAVASAMNWDHNLYAVDVATGQLRWRQRAGHYFAFSPQALSEGLAVQGYDLKSAEGYHLYLAGADGKLQRRFALYGLPRRLPHRFLPNIFLTDRINNFAVPPDGSWVASAGDLGLAVWSRAGKLLWSQDWWKTERRPRALAALGADTLLAVEGMTATANDAQTGKQRWQVRLAPGGEATKVVASPDGKTCAVLDRDGRVFVVRQGKVLATIHGNATIRDLRHLGNSGTDAAFAVNGLALSADGSLIAVVAGNHLKLYTADGGLRWVLPGDDALHSPRFSADGKRVAVGSELGTLYVLSAAGDVLLERDLGALPVPAWLPDGDLLVGTWMGTLCRLDAKYAERWRARLHPAARDMRGLVLASDGAPTTRVAFRGNAEARPAPLTPNLLDPKNAFIKLVWEDRNGVVQNGVLFAGDSAALMDGKPDAPAAPWISWQQMHWYAEGNPFTYVLIDTYRTRLRVRGITLVEDKARPESWLRDARFEYWDAGKERWMFVQTLLSDAAVHTHQFAKPIEAARFRIVLPKMLCGNLRLGEIVLHGEKLGASHPDVVAKRPVAVLFDEGNDLAGYLHRAKMTLEGAYSGNRCLTVQLGEDAYAFAPWPEGSKVFGHTLPNWDFEIVEEPKPGQYRHLQFAWKALTPGTRGIALRLDNGTHDAVTLLAGERPPGEVVANPRKVADSPPSQWKVVRVDLWEVFKKPVRIRGLRLASTGGSAAFDQIVLGRTEKDLPAARKYRPGAGPPKPGGHRQARNDLHGDPLPPGALARLGTLRFRHGQHIEAFALAPDGKTIASAGQRRIVLHDAATGKKLRSFQVEADAHSLTIAPNGNTLAAGVGSQLVCVWEVATGKRIRQFKFAEGPVHYLAFSHDGRTLAGVLEKHKVQVWDVRAAKELRRIALPLALPRTFIMALALTPDGKTLATASYSKRTTSLYLWDTAGGRELRQWQAHQGEVYSLAFSPDGKRLASASIEGDNRLRVWTVATGQQQLELPGQFHSLRFSPCGKVLAAAANGSIFLWEAGTGKEIRRLPGGGQLSPRGDSVRFSPDGKVLAVSDQWTITLWDVASGKQLSPSLDGHEQVVESVRFLAGGKTVAATSRGAVSFWQVRTSKRIGRFARRHSDHPAISPDGKVLAVASGSQTIGLWDTASGKKIRALEAPGQGSLWPLVFSPDGKTLAAAAGDRTIRFWDPITGKPLRRFADQAPGNGLAFSPDGKMLAVTDGDLGLVDQLRPAKVPTVRLVDGITGRQLRKPFELPEAAPSRGRTPRWVTMGQVAFSADGKILAAAVSSTSRLGTDPTIQVWEVATGQVLCRLEQVLAGAGELSRRFALSPDGKSLVTVGAIPRLWEVATGKMRAQVRGHSDWVWAAAFSRDGRLLATGSQDTTVLIWDTLNVNGEPPAAAKLSPKELEALWADLAGEEAGKAYRAIREMVAAPAQSVPFLRRHLRLVPAADPRHLARLIAELDDEKFTVREKATRELEKLARLARPALKQALAGRPSPETRRRVERLLKRLEQFLPTAEELRLWRAIEVLEQIGTAAAREALQTLARQGANTLPGLDARAALERLRRRAEGRPERSLFPRQRSWSN
jgi:WD40 repeat protein